MDIRASPVRAPKRFERGRVLELVNRAAEPPVFVLGEPDEPQKRFFETAGRGLKHPTPIQGRWTIDGIDLPREILEKVYHGNAERLLGVKLP